MRAREGKVEEEGPEEDEGAVEGGYDTANKEDGRSSRVRFNRYTCRGRPTESNLRGR